MRAASKPRRNATEIRASLVDAAGTLFAENGYDGVSVRDIAAAAGVQPSVVIRYFGAKGALFREVLSTTEPERLEPDILPDLPRLIAETLLDSTSTEMQRRRSMVHKIAVRSLGSNEAREIIAADLDERYVRGLAKIVPADDALARAGLVIAFTLGVQLLREVVQAPAFCDAPTERLRALMEGVLTELMNAPPAIANDRSQNRL